jgi:pyruvate/2-oxoglutarate dehydrogenase complex dihydrolipoamide acyltransferase (E2) component
MDTPRGLIVPVIKQVQSKSIVDIAIELSILQVFKGGGGDEECDDGL